MKPFLLYGGLGDHVIWLGLLANVHCQKTVICDPRMERLVRLYEGRSYDSLIITKTPAEDAFICWHGRHVGDERTYIGQRNMTIADVVRDIMGLRRDAPIAPPQWDGDADWGAMLRMDAAGLPRGRTALLAPWAHTAEIRLPDPWWADAATWLTLQGWTVATNVANRGRGFDQSRKGPILPSISGTIPVDVPLDEIGPFAELCGAVLMARSGLSDVLARVKAKVCVLWPTEGGRPLQRDVDIWSVRGIYGAAGVVERLVLAAGGFDPAVLEGWLP